MKKLEELLEWGGTKRDITFLILSAAALLASIFGFQPLPFDMAWVSVILCGIPIILEALIGLITAFDIKADVLVSIALVASIFIGEDFAAGEVAFIMQLGALLEDLTVARARAGIEKLVHLTPRTARRIGKDTEEIIPAEQVQAGDILRVFPGETVPADGIIISGETSVNQAVMTGESLPVDKSPGDEVSSGTVNQFGSFDMKAVKVGEDSSIQRMIRLVQSADAGKAKIVGIADRWATWIVIIALSAAVLTWLFTGQIIRSVTILVVFCPCALVLATPTAIMAAIGNATRHGFLVREGDALERLSLVKHLTFDKTGTLTYGAPQVVAVHSFQKNFSEQELYAKTASAELRSEHPLGKAVVRCFQASYGERPAPVESFQTLPGRGVSGTQEGHTILAGNQKLLIEKQISLDTEAQTQMEHYIQEGCTLILTAIDGEFTGFLALSDTLRDNAPETIAKVKAEGTVPVLLTGDHENAARHIASSLKIDEVLADCLPEDKLNWIQQSQDQGFPVCMIGDGVNDAPALKTAYVGAAMGSMGSDIAVEAADIALVSEELSRIPYLTRLSRSALNTIRGNIAASMCINAIAVGLSVLGLLNPVTGALVHNAGSVLVVLNGALLYDRNFEE